MNTVLVQETGEWVTLKKQCKAVRMMFGVPKVEHSYSKPGARRYKSAEYQDREAELEFERWARYLNEIIVLETYAPAHPLYPQAVMGYDRPESADIVTEAKSVYAWGLELRNLESEEHGVNSPNLHRMYQITRMLFDAGLIWRGGPSWWRTL